MWLRRLDRRRKLYIAPFQWNWLLEEVGLTTAECEEAAWAITPEGTHYRGAAAINVALDQMIGWSSVCYSVYKLPLIQHLEDRTYRWIADHRKRLPGVTPAVDQPTPWKPE